MFFKILIEPIYYISCKSRISAPLNSLPCCKNYSTFGIKMFGTYDSLLPYSSLESSVNIGSTKLLSNIMKHSLRPVSTKLFSDIPNFRSDDEIPFSAASVNFSDYFRTVRPNERDSSLKLCNRAHRVGTVHDVVCLVGQRFYRNHDTHGHTNVNESAWEYPAFSMLPDRRATWSLTTLAHFLRGRDQARISQIKRW